MQHNPVLIVTGRGHECCLPFVPLSDANEVVHAAEVQFSEDGGTT